MRHHLQAAFFRSLFIGASPPYLELAVRRAHVVRDTATQLAAVRDARDLRRQIKAHFVGEPAVDEGGVARELMALAARGVVAPEYGLFTPCGRANEVVWFLSGLPVDREAAADYELIGKLVGLALYNGIQLPIHFPLALFKKLMGEPLLLSDLAEIDPELARGLQTLLEFPEEQVRETYCCSFTIAPPPPPGSMSGTDATAAMVELVPGGADMELKGDNRKEYVAAVLNWHLNVVVADKFSMFQRGWDAVVAESSVKHLFNGGELMQVVLGDDEFDLDALAEAAVYDGGYSPESRVVQDFWAELKALSLADQRRFLFFVTGSDRPPVGGLGRVVVVIMRQGPDSDRLPSAHTCFNVLLLPEYATREKVQVMVGRAVAHMEGFGLM
ncbi:hypothetical protein BC828DRAFT_345885 [Blastocladiella britannica]|nr:hypothetical protein BC828DRAFT_345885 [Blastocladiella britannica]